MVENIQRLVGGAWLQRRTTALLYFVPSASNFAGQLGEFRTEFPLR